MRTKKEFFKELRASIKDSIYNLQEVAKEMKEADEGYNAGTYTESYILDKKRELRFKMENIRDKANDEVKRLCDEYVEELKSNDDLDPEQLNNDIELLKTGVKLSKRDIEALLKRNEDNSTMTQVILRYCDEHDIDSGRIYVGNKPIINNVNAIPFVARTVLKWGDSQTNVYNQLMGDGSDLASFFNS